MIINTSFNQAVQIAVIPQHEQKQSMEIIYRTMINSCRNQPYIRNLQKLSEKAFAISSQIGINKLINRKMRTKLINWLQKLALESFEFQSQTLLQTVRILDYYLALTNQTSSSLQLIGCASLYLASKIAQKKIVAAQCYVTACQEIFTKEELFQKQMTIFKVTGGNPSEYVSLLKFYRFIENKLLLKNQLKNYQSQIKLCLTEFSKKEQHFSCQPTKSICLLISFILTEKKVPSQEQLLVLIKQGILLK